MDHRRANFIKRFARRVNFIKRFARRLDFRRVNFIKRFAKKDDVSRFARGSFYLGKWQRRPFRQKTTSDTHMLVCVVHFTEGARPVPSGISSPTNSPTNYDCVLCIAMRALYRTLVKVYRDRRQDVAQEIERN